MSKRIKKTTLLVMLLIPVELWEFMSELLWWYLVLSMVSAVVEFVVWIWFLFFVLKQRNLKIMWKAFIFCLPFYGFSKVVYVIKFGSSDFNWFINYINIDELLDSLRAAIQVLKEEKLWLPQIRYF